MMNAVEPHVALPVVTIGLPTRNRAGTYLREALSSAVAQTYPSIEIVVSDNNSSDDTEAVVRSFQDPRIRYVRHDRHLTPNENFNFCLAQATGDYFLLLHDDDFIDPDFVDVCMRAVDYRTDFGIIRTGTRIIDSQGNVLRELPNGVGGLSTVEFFRGWFAHETALYFCSTVFNTVRLREAGGFASPRFVFQDAFAIVKLAATFPRGDIREPKASFRRHPSGRTFSTTVNDWCADSLALLKMMLTFVSDRTGIVRNEGLHFFARLNYGRAAEARSLLDRLAGSLVVFKRFNYRYPPSRARLYQLFEGTPLSSAMRFAKRTATVLLPGRSRAPIRRALQALRPYAYIGNRVTCPCCGWRLRRFLPFGVNLRPGAMCPKCRSLERHRLLWLYLTRATDLFSAGHRRVLHIAPEPVLERRLRSAPNLHYVSMDLHSARAMCHADITHLPFKDNSFDVIICYHVLEHVADDGKAMREVFRVLGNAGWALLQSPIDLRRKATYEDLTIDSPQERERVFGQNDHVRVYGRDYKDRLEEAGFNVRLDDYARTLPPALARRFGLNLSEDIYVCTKAASLRERGPALTAPASAQR